MPLDEIANVAVDVAAESSVFVVADLVTTGDDMRMIRRIVTITLSVTMILAAGYLVAVLMTDGAILLRPSEQALERHADYNDLVNVPGGESSAPDITVCIVDSGISMDHSDFNELSLAGWKDFVNNRAEPYDDHGRAHV